MKKLFLKTIFTSVIAFITLGSLSHAATMICNDVFLTEHKISAKFIEENFAPISYGKQLVDLSSGRKIALIFEKSTTTDANLKKPIFVMTHGMGESAEAHTELAQIMRDKGYDVLRVSLQGHGETLIESMKKEPIPYIIPVEDNIRDLAEVLYRVSSDRQVILVGHSYGGAVTLGVAEKFEKMGIASRIKDVVLVASFVKSLDKYYMDSVTSGMAPVQAQKLVLKTLGIPGEWVESFYSPFEKITAPISQMFQYWRDMFYGTIPVDNYRDMALKPSLEMFKMFQFPLHYAFQAPPMKGEENLKLDFGLRMKAVLAATRGVSDFNILDYSKELDLPKNVKYILVSGSTDDVVTPSMLNEFKDRLDESGYKTKSMMISGGHYLVREKPAEVAARLVPVLN